VPDLLLVQLGPLPPGLLDHLAPQASRAFHLQPSLHHAPLDPTPAYDAYRNQYLATTLLDALALLPAYRVLGVTAVDLFNPILTFVFGEAHLPGRAAVFSLHRLHEEFYGLPRSPDLLLARAVKEMLHELGHTFGLTHCSDSSCVMSSVHSVEGVDRKSASLCRRCVQAREISS
jgi:archaemetzincin